MVSEVVGPVFLSDAQAGPLVGVLAAAVVDLAAAVVDLAAAAQPSIRVLSLHTHAFNFTPKSVSNKGPLSEYDPTHCPARQLSE